MWDRSKFVQDSIFSLYVKHQDKTEEIKVCLLFHVVAVEPFRLSSVVFLKLNDFF